MSAASLHIGLIVEGHGEVAAAPILVRRLLAASGTFVVTIPPPLRLPKGKMLKDDELARAVEFMARRTAPHGALLVLVDADADCPYVLGSSRLDVAKRARGDRPVSVVVAKREFESWFVAAATSLQGQRGLQTDLTPPPDPECIQNPKAWLGDRMPRGYSETLDQPAFASVFDLKAAAMLPSFDKLMRDLARLVDEARALRAQADG